MALDAIVSTIEDLGDDIKKEYIPGSPEKNQDPEKFYLDVTPSDGWALEDVVGLKTVLGEVKSDRTKLRERLSTFGDLDVEEAQAAIKFHQKYKDNPPKNKEITAQVEQLEAKHKNERNEDANRIKSLTSKVHELLIVTAAREALAKHELQKGGDKLLMPHIEKMCRIDEESGNFVARVLDEKGQPRISMKQGSIEPMSIAERVELMKDEDDYSAAFKGSGASGTGATGGINSTGTRNAGNNLTKAVFNAKNPVETMRAARAAQEAQGG